MHILGVFTHIKLHMYVLIAYTSSHIIYAITITIIVVVTVNFNETDYSVSEGGTIVVHVIADGPSAEDYDVSIVLTPGSAGSNI